MFFRGISNFLILLVISILLIFVYILSVQDSTSIIELEDNTNDNELSYLSDNNYCDKWIVLTTINSPTTHVKYLRDTALGWCVVVVADQKTPVSWQYKDVYFLSIEKQKELMSSFKIIEHIEYNSYLRKMIGYLYAMSKNAKEIYETDDDNAPTDGLFGFRHEHLNGMEADCNQKFINPYAYFGQPSVWPRGYPLDKISEPLCHQFSLYTLKKVKKI